MGRCPLELAQGPSSVALAWHKAGGCTPFGVTSSLSDPGVADTEAAAHVGFGVWRYPVPFFSFLLAFGLKSGLDRPSRLPNITHNTKNNDSGAGNASATLFAASGVSQRSLHNAPIFRLLLKVAVNGTHQCDFQNFCGALAPQLRRVHAHAHIGTHARLCNR
jgi:hypothetical protein